MKILYVLQSLTDSSCGGLTIVEIVKANALASKGHEVILCYTNCANSEEETLRPISPKVKLIWDTRKCPWLRLSEEHHDSVHVKRQVCYPSEL
jgi:hypothetical protein